MGDQAAGRGQKLVEVAPVEHRAASPDHWQQPQPSGVEGELGLVGPS